MRKGCDSSQNNGPIIKAKQMTSFFWHCCWCRKGRGQLEENGEGKTACQMERNVPQDKLLVLVAVDVLVDVLALVLAPVLVHRLTREG